MFVSRLLVPAIAGVAAVVLAGCSSARFDGLDALGYGGVPARETVRPMAAAPVSRTAPVETVDRGNADPIRYHAPTTAPPRRSGRDAYPNAAYQQAAVANRPYGAGTATRRQPAALGGCQDRAGARFGTKSEGSAGGNRGAVPTPRAEPAYRRSGTARWMGASWSAHTTTTQEPFDPDRLTGAHATLPLPSFVYVTSRATGRTVLIRVNDRPPVAHGDRDTIVVVSRRVADLLGFSRAGTAEVDLQYAGPAGLETSGRHEDAFLRQQPWFGRAAGAGGTRQATAMPEPAPGTPESYAPPGYPRWDGTRR